jgi:uncharacterized iron-regulated protein
MKMNVNIYGASERQVLRRLAWMFPAFCATMEAMRTKIPIVAVAVTLLGALAGCGMTDAVRMGDQQKIPIARMVEEVRDAPLIFVGEIHDDPEHHELQERVVRGVHSTGHPLAIGLEMFNADSQPELDAWTEGRLDPGRFAALYARNWKEPLGLYAGIFRYAHAHRIPLVGLNVPRELIQKVMRHGIEGLPEEVRGDLPPDIRCGLTGDYLAFLERVYAGHAGGKDDIDHFCQAMTLWNSLMARNIAAYLRNHPGTAMVVLAGAGHARKKGGIPEQLDREGERYQYRVILPALPNLVELPRATSADADYLVEEPWSQLRWFFFGY